MKIVLIIITSLFLVSACSSGEDIATAPQVEKTEKTILALGDSLTAGLGLPIADAYPSQLEERLREKGYNYILINAGISGDTTAGLLSRLDWALDASPHPEKGDGGGFALVILCIGANDAFQGKNTTEIEKNLRQIIEKIQAKKIPILLAGMRAPMNLGIEYSKQYESLFPKLAKEYKLVFMPFFLEGVALKANLNQDDRIHPTKEGYAIVAENLMGILEGEGLVGR